jgi:hypothetical protein
MNSASGRNRPNPHSALVARDEQEYEDIDDAFDPDGWQLSDALIGLAIAAPLCIAILFYFGDVANLKIVRSTLELAPNLTQLLSKTSPRLQTPPVASPQDAAVSPMKESPAAAATPSRTPPVELSSVVVQLPETVVRDLADLAQQIEQLKAGQAKMADDGARVAEQVKTIREQFDRIIAAKASDKASDKAPEQYDRSPSQPVPPGRRAASHPVRAVPPPQAAAAE